jgi:putative adhesin
MGKRELLLVISFAAAGFILYQVTAPASPADANGFSVSRLLEQARRNIHGNRSSAEVSSTHTEKLDGAIDELRLTLRAAELSVVGEPREDVAFDLRVSSTGYDEAEAKRWAEATVLKVDRAGPAMVVELKYPREARQTAKLTIKVPSSMRVRMEPSGGRVDIASVAAFEAGNTSGTATITNIAGAVTINHRGGELTIDRAASLRLTTRGTETKIQHISGTVTAQTISGELTAMDITGPVEIDARDTDVRLENIKGLKAPLRVNANNGSVRIAGLRTEARIDGNDTDLEIAFDAPAPVTIYNTSQDITVTPPAAGYSLDAVATDGRITIEDGAVKPTGETGEQRATGSIRGGGASLTLRATRGDIVVRPHAGK